MAAIDFHESLGLVTLRCSGKAPVVIYRTAGGESLFANVKPSLVATQDVFGSHLVDQHVLDQGCRREYICLSELAFNKLSD